MLGLTVDRTSNRSISYQIYNQLREKIIIGELKVGLRLPPTRQLSEALVISRNIIIEVYDQLMSEGYLRGKTGSGTYVASGIQVRKNHEDKNEWNLIKGNTKMRSPEPIDFISGMPDLSLFPQKNWEKSIKEAFDTGTGDLLGYGSLFGDPELRECLSEYLFESKGIQCAPENLIITAGASQGLFLIAKALAGNFKTLYLEEPSVDFIQDIFLHSGYGLSPVEVDEEGLCLEKLAVDDNKKLVFLTPSFQFPTGSILSIQRRQALIEWVHKTDSILIEDGYDSEFRYKGLMAPPLLTMDYQHIIYVGTFSKNLCPGLRLGYLIIPPNLKATLKQVKSDLNLFTSQMDQKALARFIGNGYLSHHIYQMKKVYRKKQQILLNALRHLFGNQVEITSNDAGMHLIVKLPEPFTQRRIDWHAAEAYGVRVYPLDDFYSKKTIPTGRLVLGYGNLKFEEIEKGVQALGLFLEQVLKE